MKSTKSHFLYFLLPLAIGLTFPFQVIFNNRKAGALSILIMFSIVVLSVITKSRKNPPNTIFKHSRNWDLIVMAFLGLSLINLVGTMIMFDFESVNPMSALFLILQAGQIYVIFSRIASDSEIHAFLIGAVVMAVLSGGFFIFESFNKLILGQITAYTLRAHEYTLSAQGQSLADQAANHFRVNITYRSFGLLERHTTSALWTAFGFFAYAFIEYKKSRVAKALALTCSVLFITQNFTVFIVFCFVIILTYRYALEFKATLVPLICFMISAIMIGREEILQFLFDAFAILQEHLFSGLSWQMEDESMKYSSLVASEFTRYWSEILERPQQLLLGYGVGTNPFYSTSGDVGFFETMMRLGLPLWLLLTWNIFGLTLKGISAQNSLRRTLDTDSSRDAKVTLVASALLSSIWLADLHYSAWTNKSIWPILFFGMALAHRQAITRTRNIQEPELFRKGGV